MTPVMVVIVIVGITCQEGWAAVCGARPPDWEWQGGGVGHACSPDDFSADNQLLQAQG